MDSETRIDTNNMDFSIDKEGCAEKSGCFGKQSLGVDVVGSLHSQEISNDEEVNENLGLGFNVVD